MAAAGDDLESGLARETRVPRAANRLQMPPIVHCVAFCGSFGVVFIVSGAVLLSSALPYRRLQLRIISFCMLGLGVVLLTCAIALTVMWRRRRAAAGRRECWPHPSSALALHVPTVSSSSYMYASDPAMSGVISTGTVSPPSPLPPPPAYEDVVLPPPSYSTVMMLKEQEMAAEAQRQAAEAQRRGSAPAASPAAPVQA